MLFRVSKVSKSSEGFLGKIDLNITLWFIEFKVTSKTKIYHEYYTNFVNLKK